MTVMTIGLACGSTEPHGVPITPGSSPTPVPTCLPQQSVVPSPIRDPNGPFFHQVLVGNTTTGTSLTGAREVLDHASVPDGVRLPNGAVYLYYVNGASGGAIWVARLVSGVAEVIGPVTLNGVPAPAGAVDPDVVLLPNGRLQLAYLATQGPLNASSARAICIAEGSDPATFTARGTALEAAPAEQLTDPSQLQLGDGSWLMAISRGQQTIIARSPDGTAYTREATLAIGGVPELALAPDGAIRLYTCAGGIVSRRSTDAGRTWTLEGTVVGPGYNGRPIVCDPSLVAGTGLFVFKTG